jgi:mRNA-degrading endonuclease RelE of RelBE toxin-antitoxin system
MEFYCTSDFKKAVQKLTQKKKYRYNSCIEDIKQEFLSKKFQEIIDSSFKLPRIGDIQVIKLRIKNSEQNIGKRGGYRIIALAHLEKQIIIFLFLYPKRGRFEQENFDESTDLPHFLENFRHERENKTLIFLDIQNMKLEDFKT